MLYFGTHYIVVSLTILCVASLVSCEESKDLTTSIVLGVLTSVNKITEGIAGVSCGVSLLLWYTRTDHPARNLAFGGCVSSAVIGMSTGAALAVLEDYDRAETTAEQSLL